MIGQQQYSPAVSSNHKVFSPQPVKLSGFNGSFESSWSVNSLSPDAMMGANFNLNQSQISPVRRLLFSSPDEQSQQPSQPALFLQEINRLRADSMNQLENEINRNSQIENQPFDNDLLLEQLEQDFANFPY